MVSAALARHARSARAVTDVVASGPRITIRDVDRGWERIKKLIETEAAKDSYVKVGYLDDGGKGSVPRTPDLTLAQIGAIMEFGSEDKIIPARPHIRPTFDKKRDELAGDAARLLRMVLDGKMTVSRALGILGAKLATEIKKTVTTGPPIPPPNAPSTLKRKQALTRPGSKGSVRTLIDTGRLIVSIVWAVIVERKPK